MLQDTDYTFLIIGPNEDSEKEQHPIKLQRSSSV